MTGKRGGIFERTERKTRFVFSKEGGHTVSPFHALVVLSIVSKWVVKPQKGLTDLIAEQRKSGRLSRAAQPFILPLIGFTVFANLPPNIGSSLPDVGGYLKRIFGICDNSFYLLLTHTLQTSTRAPGGLSP